MRSARLDYNFHAGPFLYGHLGPYGALIRTDGKKTDLIQLPGQLRRVHTLLLIIYFARKFVVKQSGRVQGCEQKWKFMLAIDISRVLIRRIFRLVANAKLITFYISSLEISSTNEQRKNGRRELFRGIPLTIIWFNSFFRRDFRMFSFVTRKLFPNVHNAAFFSF